MESSFGRNSKRLHIRDEFVVHSIDPPSGMSASMCVEAMLCMKKSLRLTFQLIRELKMVTSSFGRNSEMLTSIGMLAYRRHFWCTQLILLPQSRPQKGSIASLLGTRCVEVRSQLYEIATNRATVKGYDIKLIIIWRNNCKFSFLRKIEGGTHFSISNMPLPRVNGWPWNSLHPVNRRDLWDSHICGHSFRKKKMEYSYFFVAWIRLEVRGQEYFKEYAY